MRSLVTALMISSLTLPGCSGFGTSQAAESAPAPGAQTANPLIPEESDSILRRKSDAEVYQGTPIYAVQNVAVERASGGAIVKATGLSLRQGAFDVRLIAENKGEPVGGVLTYTLRALQRTDTPQGPEQTRRVTAGQLISNQTLDAVSEIRVLGQTNSATSRR